MRTRMKTNLWMQSILIVFSKACMNPDFRDHSPVTGIYSRRSNLLRSQYHCNATRRLKITNTHSRRVHAVQPECSGFYRPLCLCRTAQRSGRVRGWFCAISPARSQVRLVLCCLHWYFQYLRWLHQKHVYVVCEIVESLDIVECQRSGSITSLSAHS